MSALVKRVHGYVKVVVDSLCMPMEISSGSPYSDAILPKQAIRQLEVRDERFHRKLFS
jgi:hypothetical protein